MVKRSQFGIDYHTAALHRSNLPQIRIAPDDKELLALADAFAPPVVLTSKLRDGSLRWLATEPMREELARHDAILRGAVEAHGGHVLKSTGDGVHAAFDDARDALAQFIGWVNGEPDRGFVHRSLDNKVIKLCEVS